MPVLSSRVPLSIRSRPGRTMVNFLLYIGGDGRPAACRLSTLLTGVEGQFIVSINDTPEIRAIFAGFAIEEVAVNYRLSGRATVLSVRRRPEAGPRSA